MPSNKSKGSKSGPKSYGLGRRGQNFDVPLPSGNVCLARHVGIDDLIKAGVIDSMDSLTAMVQDLHISRVQTGKAKNNKATGAGDQATPQQVQAFVDLVKDKKRFTELLRVVDAVVCEAVVEPKVWAEEYRQSPIPEGEFYVSDVDLTDRFAIFAASIGQALRGVQALEPFRSVSQQDVADVADVQGVRGPAVDIPSS